MVPSLDKNVFFWLTMDPAPLAELFRRTLDPTTRAEAESKLQEMHKIIGFALGGRLSTVISP